MGVDKVPVTVIIPVLGTVADLDKVLNRLEDGSFWPERVLVILSGYESSDAISNAIDDMRERYINTFPVDIVRVSEILYPGAARNFGASISTTKYLGFLDKYTIPSVDWLASLGDSDKPLSAEGHFGSTVFMASGYTRTAVRDVLFGRISHLSVPGTLIRRDLFEYSGGFLESQRAGEDTDFMARIRLLFPSFPEPYSTTCEYEGISKNTPKGFATKWFRNYISCGSLKKYALQRALLTVFWTALVLLAFHWNSYVANWNDDHALYFPHIVTLLCSSMIGLYVALRIIYLPLCRDVPLRDVIRQVPVMLVTAISLDMIKTLGITVSVCTKS